MSAERRGTPRPEIVEAFRSQSQAARAIGSPLYTRLLSLAADEIEAGGPLAEIVEGWSGQPLLDALPLRLLGAVHRLVLDGEAPQLARHYPSVGGAPEWPALGRCFLDLVAARRDELRARLRFPVQTNEIGRCAVLLGGFLRVAERSRLPLRLLELGASAGLNLLWDRYRYELGDQRWGDPEAEVVIRARWEGAAPRGPARVAVASRAGCDPAPLDVTDAAQARTLESFVWPDQPERMDLLRAGIAVARRDPPALARSGAAAWLERELAVPARGRATVVFHSVVWWYIPEAERALISRRMETAGAQASPEAPLAWLRMEGVSLEEAELRLRQWPPGHDELLGRGHYHGRAVRWQAPPA